MNRLRRGGLRTWNLLLLGVTVAFAAASTSATEQETGALVVSTVDAATGKPTATAAGLFRMDEAGETPIWTDYASLKPGAYEYRVEKGPEYKKEVRKYQIQAGKTITDVIKMTRWIHMAEKGWYSGDCHIHWGMETKEMSRVQCEGVASVDLNVANSLQMGSPRGFDFPQHSFGLDSVAQNGNYCVASGQENPRTNVLEHVVILGQKSYIDVPNEKYLVYRNFFEEAKRQGAVSGFAHKGSNTEWGVAPWIVDIDRGLVAFIEVLQQTSLGTPVWYDLLNMGYRIAPVGSSDYPYLGQVGLDRFYTKVEGPLTYESWLKGLRQGRTFVTNGPMLEFRVNGADVGSEVKLKGPGKIKLEGRALFGPHRNPTQTVKVIVNGEAIHEIVKNDVPEIVLSLEHAVKDSCWVAMLAFDTPGAIGKSAHTAAVYVTVEKGGLALKDQPKAKETAGRWKGNLEKLAGKLAEDQVSALVNEFAYGNAELIGFDQFVTLQDVRANRKALLEVVEEARKFLADRMK